jgi:hypothetical protein
VVLPIPFHQPSRNSKLIPNFTYSVCLRNQNSTDALSLICIPPVAMMPSITAFCGRCQYAPLFENPDKYQLHGIVHIQLPVRKQGKQNLMFLQWQRITRGCSVVVKCVRFVVHTVVMKNINVFSM